MDTHCLATPALPDPRTSSIQLYDLPHEHSLRTGTSIHEMPGLGSSQTPLFQFRALLSQVPTRHYSLFLPSECIHFH